MSVQVYENFVLENKINDILMTKLDMYQFATKDESLALTEGMKKVVNVYTASGNVEDLAMGQGNTGDIGVAFETKEYDIMTTQGRFPYFDEQAMTDSVAIDTGIRGLTDTMTNDLTTKVVNELKKATLTTAFGVDFNSIVDAIGKYPYEVEDGLFLIVSQEDKAEMRKALGDDLKYVEAFARTGYIGSVAGVPVYFSKAIPQGEAYLATKEAITIFVKKGVEVEQERDADKRQNTVYARKYMVVALTDATKVVKLA